MTEPKWDEKELRTWARLNMGFAIPKSIKIRVMKWIDNGNYVLLATDIWGASIKEDIEYLRRLAAIVRRCGGYAFIKLSDDRFLQWASLEIDMGGTIADVNKQAQKELWEDSDV